MKNKIVLIAACLVLAGCAGVIAAQSITAVSETVSGYAVQHKGITASQLSVLAKDLAALPGTALPSSDNVVIANILSEAAAKKQADLTAASAVDAINTGLTNVLKGRSPTVADGIAWANLQDIIIGMQQETVVLAQNPNLIPTP